MIFEAKETHSMSEIAWHTWSEEAFADARAQDRPILLSLVAPWCQYCRAMDEQTYGNEALVQYINENFVAIRVDSDRRPDINARYTQGGWPSTCILTGEGDLLWGGTFVPPDGMAQLLSSVLDSYRRDKNGLAQHVQQIRQQVRERNAAPPLDPNSPISPEIPTGVLLGAKFEFDFAFGGFGHNGQKFPHVDTTEFVLEQYARTVQAGEPDADLRFILDRTLSHLATGGLWDAHDGGFFRYAQTPDWRNPQIEKLLEDNAQVARIYIRAYQLLGEEAWKTHAQKTLEYLTTHLRLEDKPVFGGSQEADAEYYAQPIAERSEWNPPAVDTTVFAGANAHAVRAFVAWWAVTGDAEALASARAALDYVLAHLVGDDGVVSHFEPADPDDLESAGRVPTGLLSDAADVAAACLDLYEAGQGVSYLDTAEEIATWVRGHLEDPNAGGLFDAPVRPDAIGNLKVPARDVRDNMRMADGLFRLFLATGEDEHAKLAQRILQSFQPAAPQLGFFGASLALAIERAALPPVLVYVLGTVGDAKTDALLAAAHRPYRFERFVQPLDPANEDDAAHIENLGFDATLAPIAHVQVAATPLAPTVDPETLVETIRGAVWDNPGAVLDALAEEA
jgi:uncharacterized protein YyaL (SSP411 family)